MDSVTLIKDLMSYTDYLSKLVEITLSMRQACTSANFNLLMYEANRKDKIINILEIYKKKIQPLIIRMDWIELLEAWKSDLVRCTKIIDNIDREIISELEKEKNIIKNDLLLLNKTRFKFKGYNLNSVRR